MVTNNSLRCKDETLLDVLSFKYWKLGASDYRAGLCCVKQYPMLWKTRAYNAGWNFAQSYANGGKIWKRDM